MCVCVLMHLLALFFVVLVAVFVFVSVVHLLLHFVCFLWGANVFAAVVSE